MNHQSRWYKTGWTDERKTKQREAIHRWKPWTKSTGPKTERGKAESASNGAYAFLKKRTTRELLRWAKKF